MKHNSHCGAGAEVRVRIESPRPSLAVSSPSATFAVKQEARLTLKPERLRAGRELPPGRERVFRPQTARVGTLPPRPQDKDVDLASDTGLLGKRWGVRGRDLLINISDSWLVPSPPGEVTSA